MSLLAAFVSLSWTAAIWWRVHDLARHWRLTLALIPAAGLAVVLASPALWQAAMGGYPGDSFWTLPGTGRWGVILISTGGLVAVFMLLAAKSRAFTRWPAVIAIPADVITGIAIYGVIHTISPQVFYSFYLLIFPDLPQQIVIRTFFDTDRLFDIAQLSVDGTLSDHLAGVGLWAVLPFTLWQHRLRR